MKCLHCVKPIENQDIYGLHIACFEGIFGCSPNQFNDLSRKDFISSPHGNNMPYLSSFFAGNYRKYEAKLGNNRYILKFQESGFPELVAVEYISNKIAQSLHIPVASPFCVIILNHEPCFVVQNFMTHTGSPQNLVHIYHYLTPGDQHYTLSELVHAIRSETESDAEVRVFLNVLLFDALIGNHDRHGRNIALIETARKKVLSPIYDNVSALGLESGSWLNATWNPKGKIATTHSNEPSMTDYVLAIRDLGYSDLLHTFEARLLKLDYGSIINSMFMLSPEMKSALIRLIQSRLKEFNDAKNV
ncbi:MAG: HipA domain-containing protein [bacterium]|nr:HipA domain-containing protein [bacterium]